MTCSTGAGDVVLNPNVRDVNGGNVGIGVWDGAAVDDVCAAESGVGYGDGWAADVG